MLKEKVAILIGPTATGDLTTLSLKTESFSVKDFYGPGILFSGKIFICFFSMVICLNFIVNKNFCRKSLRTLPLNEKRKERVAKRCNFLALQNFLPGVKKHCKDAIKTKFKTF